MKRCLLIAASSLLFLLSFAQNIGIGTTTPGFPMNFASTLGDKVSFWGNSGNHYGIGIQSALLQIHSATGSDDIAFGYGSSGSFTETMRIKGSGVLQFPANLGKKIILYPGGVGDAHLAVWGNEFRISSDYSGADITFGYDNRSTGFIENMRLKGNGNLGIGTNNPGYLLDVNNRMRIASGGNPSNSAGIWFNKTDNSSLQAFIGIEDDSHIGFFGNNGANWKFAMNTATGALQVNGSEGATGLVLSSNGSAPASWISSTNALYNNTNCLISNTYVNATSGGGNVNLPDMTYSFSVGGNFKLLISYAIPVYTNSCSFCGASDIYIDIDLNGGLADRNTWDVDNDHSFTLTYTRLFSLSAGAYTIQLQGSVIGPTTRFGCGGSCVLHTLMNIQIIPQ